MSAIIHLHAESVRVGIRLAAHYFAGSNAAEDRVTQILRSLPNGYKAEEFPLAVLSDSYRDRSRMRRESSQRILEALLHHAGDPALLTDNDIEKFVVKAYKAAIALEDQDMAQGVIEHASKE